MDLHWRNLDSRSAINEDPPLKSLAKSWKLSHTRDMGPCAHTQCGFLHPSLFFLPSPSLDSRSSQLTWLCQHPLQNGSAEWRARGLKGQLKATHTKVQHLQKSLSEELIRIFAVSAFFTQRERGQSQHQRQKLHFSLSHFFFFLHAPLSFCFQTSGLNSTSGCKPCCFSTFLFSLKRAVLLSSFRLPEQQWSWWKGVFLQICCSGKKRVEWDMTIKEKKKVVRLRTWNIVPAFWIFNYRTYKHLNLLCDFIKKLVETYRTSENCRREETKGPGQLWEEAS